MHGGIMMSTSLSESLPARLLKSSSTKILCSMSSSTLASETDIPRERQADSRVVAALWPPCKDFIRTVEGDLGWVPSVATVQCAAPVDAEWTGSTGTSERLALTLEVFGLMSPTEDLAGSAADGLRALLSAATEPEADPVVVVSWLGPGDSQYHCLPLPLRPLDLLPFGPGPFTWPILW